MNLTILTKKMYHIKLFISSLTTRYFKVLKILKIMTLDYFKSTEITIHFHSYICYKNLKFTVNSTLLVFKWKSLCKTIPLLAISRIFNFFLVCNYSAFPRNEMAQAKAINSDWTPYFWTTHIDPGVFRPTLIQGYLNPH